MSTIHRTRIRASKVRRPMDTRRITTEARCSTERPAACTIHPNTTILTRRTTACRTTTQLPIMPTRC